MHDKETEKISVIVPLYNGEKTIKRCIDSIQKQTYNNIEIIVVDDGSTDNSVDIVQKFGDSVQMIQNKHQGVSATRNTGIDNAQGKYIAFVDSDDEILPTMLEELYNGLVSNNTQLSIVGIERVNDTDGSRLFLKYDEQEIYIEKDAARIYAKSGYFNSCSNKLYLSELIKNYNIHFPIDVSIGEDCLFNSEYCRYVDKTAVISKPLYIYHINSGTLSSSDKHRLDAVERMYLSLAELSDGKYKIEIQRKICDEYLYAIRLYCGSRASFAEKINYVKRILHGNVFNMSDKEYFSDKGKYGLMVRTKSAFLVCLYFFVSGLIHKRKK